MISNRGPFVPAFRNKGRLNLRVPEIIFCPRLLADTSSSKASIGPFFHGPGFYQRKGQKNTGIKVSCLQAYLACLRN